MKVLIKNDLLIGTVNGNAIANALPIEFENNDLTELRFDDDSIVLGSDYTVFFIDEFATKHIIRHVQSWQSLSCEFNDKLIFDDNPSRWRVRTQADDVLDDIANRNAIARGEAGIIAESSVPDLLDYNASDDNAPQSLKDKNAAHKAKLNEVI